MKKTAAAFALLLTTFISRGQDVLVAANARWDYLVPTNGVDPAIADTDFNTTWQRAVGYNGPAFTTNAQAPFHYGGLVYLISTGLPLTTWPTPASGSRYTAYMRTTFTAAQDYPATSIEVVADDGAVIYLDGVELKRVNFAVNKLDRFTVMADGVARTEDGVATEDSPPLVLSTGAISAGQHTLSVSVHNADTTSSDLGIYLRLLGSPPPPPPVLVHEKGGTSTNVLVDGAVTGWVSPRTGAWRMNGTGTGGPYTVQSSMVDLATEGAAYFSMMVYLYEVSNTSNFEATDEFAAKLEVIFDDDSGTEYNLIPAELDTDGNGTLTGEEFALGRAATDLVFLSKQLSVPIPANVKSARLIVSGINDSSSENFLWGNARVSDIAPGSDADGDGQTREDEFLAGTDPANGNSAVRATDVTTDSSTGTLRLAAGLPLSAGKHYMLEGSTDATLWTLKGEYLPMQDFTGVIINLDTPQPGRVFYRVRVVP